MTDETIRVSRLGFVDSVSIPTREGDHCFRARGVIIPWFDGDRLPLVKLRQPEGMKPKYVEAYRDRPRIFPSPTAVRPGRPLVIVEGKFDALLLGQEIGHLAAVVTLGSASSKPDPDIFLPMLAAPVWYVAHDADKAGDLAASGWPARARRVRPPGAFKDWTEAAQASVNLRRWWSDRLAGTETPPLFSWEELAVWRWGPARDDPTPRHHHRPPRPGNLPRRAGSRRFVRRLRLGRPGGDPGGESMSDARALGLRDRPTAR